jgi:hypothetical protein
LFKNETVFILGVGASWHYGYPTGEELVKKVARRARDIANFYDQENVALSSLGWPAYLMDRSPAPSDVRAKGIAECRTLADRISRGNPLVIDYFLAQNPELRDIGKLIIGLVILECESAWIEERGNINRREQLANSPNNASIRSEITRYNETQRRLVPVYRV